MVLYLMQGSEAVDIGGVDVGAAPDEAVDLVAVGGGAGGEEDAAVGELDPAGLVLRLARLQERVGLLPPLQLLRPLEQGRRRARLKRHLDDDLTSNVLGHISLYHSCQRPDLKCHFCNLAFTFWTHSFVGWKLATHNRWHLAISNFT